MLYDAVQDLWYFYITILPGDPEPSEADVETTVRLMEAGAILGIPVLDHIVIGDGNYVSMKARGMI